LEKKIHIWFKEERRIPPSKLKKQALKYLEREIRKILQEKEKEW
jgi:hypothetical protein